MSTSRGKWEYMTSCIIRKCITGDIIHLFKCISFLKPYMTLVEDMSYVSFP